jgi:osmoprotectant transport system substrate-binding protein
LRVLVDDRGLEPSENVTPVVSRSLLARYGTRLSGTLDAVSAELTTEQLTALDRAVAAGRAPAKVAGEWLAARGFD